MSTSDLRGPLCRFPNRGALPSRLFLALSLLIGPAALAGSVTDESVMSKGNAIGRAMSQIPRNAVVTRKRCREISVGIGNFRYRCTIWYEDAPPEQP